MQIDRDKLIEAIHEHQGVATAVAQHMGVARKTIYRARDKWPSVVSAFEEARGDYDTSLLDEAELKLRTATRNGDAWAVKYVLDKKGKARGYVDESRTEVTGKDGEDLILRVVYDDLRGDTDA